MYPCSARVGCGDLPIAYVVDVASKAHEVEFHSNTTHGPRLTSPPCYRIHVRRVEIVIRLELREETQLLFRHAHAPIQTTRTVDYLCLRGSSSRILRPRAPRARAYG